MLAVVKVLGYGMAHVFGSQLTEWGTDVVVRHYTDHSLGLGEAVEKAHAESWKALGVALAGDRLIDRCRRLFLRGDLRGFRAEVSAFLDNAPLPEGIEEFREGCLTDLQRLRRAKAVIDPQALAKSATDLARFANPEGAVDRAWDAVRDAADRLSNDYPKLAALLRMPVPDAPPLLVSAFTHFLEQRIAGNATLASRLQARSLSRLAATQDAAFVAVGKALDRLGTHADEVLDQLDRIESAVDETRDAVHELHDLLGRVVAGTGAGGPRLVVSADDDREQEYLRRVREEYRHAPPGKQTAAGWMLLGDSLAAAGLIAESADDHEQAARIATDPATQAEAWFKAFRASAQSGDTARALTAYRAAVA